MSYYPQYNERAPGEAASRNRTRTYGEHYHEQNEYRDYREQDERTSPRQSHASARAPPAPMNPAADLGISPWTPVYNHSYHGRPNLDELAGDLREVSDFVSPEGLSERNARPRAHGGLNTLNRLDDPPQFFTPNNPNQQHVSVYQPGEQPVFSDPGSNAWDHHAETASRTSMASYGLDGRASSSSISESPQDERPYSFDGYQNSPTFTRPYPRSPQSDTHQDLNWRQAEEVTVDPRSVQHTAPDYRNSRYAGSESTGAPHLHVNDTPYRGTQTPAYTHHSGGSSRRTSGRRHTRVPSNNSTTHLDPLHSTLSRSSSGSGPRVSPNGSSPRVSTTRGTTQSTSRRRGTNGRHQRTQSHTHPARPQPETSNEPRAIRFPCDFLFAGCHANFASKNEWKRHLSTQHLQEYLWRCELHPCNSTGRATAAFNRKDLLGQHIKRMHSHIITPHYTLPRMQDEMKFLNRVMPQESECGFCGTEFRGDKSWDKRMEHVGKHYEDGHDEGYEVGQSLIAWSMREGLVKIVSDRYALVAAGKEQAQMGREVHVAGRDLI